MGWGRVIWLLSCTLCHVWALLVKGAAHMIRSTRVIHFVRFFIIVLRVDAAKLLQSSEKNKKKERVS
jgi:hypothetical protein